MRDANNVEVSFGSAPVRTSFTYTGREYEPELNMYYYRARYYDPSTGRFLQMDPDPGRVLNPATFINKYGYSGNNPIMSKDPSGRIFGIDDLVFILIFAIAGSIAESNQDQDRYSFRNVFNGAIKGIAIASAIIGVSSIIGGLSGAAAPGTFGKYTLNSLGGFVNGLLQPGLGSEIAAGVLAIPAAIGLFDESSGLKDYSRAYLNIGSAGYVLKAALYFYATDTFGVSEIGNYNGPLYYRGQFLGQINAGVVNELNAYIWANRVLRFGDALLPQLGNQ